jgi:hypothetical protein
MSVGDLGEGKYIITVEANKSISEIRRFTKEVKASSTETKRSFTQVAGAATGLVSSLASTAFAYQNLDKAQTNIERQTNLVAKAQLRLNNLQKEGKTDTDQYKIAQQDLQIAQERLTQSQDALQRSQFNFGLGLITLASSTIPNAVKSITGLFPAHVSAATGAGAHTTANVALTGSIRGLTRSMLVNPLFIIPTLAAIGIGVGVLASGIMDVDAAVIATNISMTKGTTVTTNYATALDPTLSGAASNAAKELRGLKDAQLELTEENKAFLKIIQSQMKGTTSGFGGAIEFYRKQDEFLSKVKSDFDLLKEKGKSLEFIIGAITEEHEAQALAVGFTTEQLQRQVRVYEAIERSLKRIEKLEKERAREKKNQVSEIVSLAGRDIIDDALDNLNAQLGDVINNPEDYNDAAGVEAALRAKIAEVRSFSNKGKKRFADPTRGKSSKALGGQIASAFNMIASINRFGNISVSEFSQNQMATLAGLGRGSIAAARASVGRPTSKGAAGTKRAGGHSPFRSDRLSGQLINMVAMLNKDTLNSPQFRNIAAVNNIPLPRTFEKFFEGSNKALFRTRQGILRQITTYREAFLAQVTKIREAESNRISLLTGQLGITISQLKALESTVIGQDEIDGRLDFLKRNGLISTGVV